MNRDKEGNKVAQKHEKRSVISANKRARRIQRIHDIGSGRVFAKQGTGLLNVCQLCGFHIRTNNHVNGSHHRLHLIKE